MTKTLTEAQYKIKMTQFYFSSCTGVFLGNSRLMNERFQIYINMIQIQLASTVIAPAWEKVSSAASGGWENCHLASEHVHISSLLLNNFMKKQ
jgi:hypothetical protein